MGKIVLFYKSKCGATKRYAEYISTQLNCEMRDPSGATDEEINEYDTIIYGGGVYAGAIVGSSFLNNHEEVLKGKKLIVFAVGLTEYDEYNPSEKLFKTNIPKSLLDDAHTFNLFGALDLKKLKIMERFMIKSMINNLKNKASYLKTPTDDLLIKNGKKGIDLVDFDLCASLIEYAKSNISEESLSSDDE